jgi:phosphopentomutase
MTRAVVVVLDSFGIGAAPDAERFGDVGANTLGSIARWAADQGRPLHLPNLCRLGLAHAAHVATGQWPEGLPRSAPQRATYAACAEQSSGKDTPSGHWEMMGCPVPFDWGFFPSGQAGENIFPADLMQRWMREAGLQGTLGNCHASGTEIIERLGDEHVRTGWPICYTSADSVFQVAAHEAHFGLERLLHICELAKPIFDEARIARVIARPFVGDATSYRRTGNRRDLTTPPPQDTLLDRLSAQGREVISVGKIGDIFAYRGTGEIVKAEGNAALCQATLDALKRCSDGGLVFSNLVDFDMHYGHRRDIAGYADALNAFDQWLPNLEAALRPGDVLVLTADHGCDPAWPGSDHTREHVPLLMCNPGWQHTLDGGVRSSFADIGQTLAWHLGVGPLAHGRSLLGEQA